MTALIQQTVIYFRSWIRTALCYRRCLTTTGSTCRLFTRRFFHLTYST